MQLPLAIVLDSEESVRDAAAAALRGAGLDVVTALSGDDALEIARSRPVAVALLGDVGHGAGRSGLLDRLRRVRPTAVVGLLDGAADGAGTEALRAELFDVLPRLSPPSRIAVFGARAILQHRLVEEVRRLRMGNGATSSASGRAGDVALRVRDYVEGVRELNGLPPITVAPDALAALSRHDWTGREGELRNAVETAVILAADGTLRLRDLPAVVQDAGASASAEVRADRRFRDAKRIVVDAFERAYLSDLLKRHGGNVTAAAEHSGMLRSALQRLLRKHDIRSSSFRASPPVGSPPS
jgi:DNA-binding NtrC family response regulator